MCFDVSYLLDQQPSAESFQMLGNIQAGLGRRGECEIVSFKKSIELDPFRAQITSGAEAVLGEKNSVLTL